MKIVSPALIPPAFAQHSRASTATYIDDAGVLQTAAANVMRFQGGLPLVEGEATNLLLQSRLIGSTSWLNVNMASAPGPAGIDGQPSRTISVTGTTNPATYQQPGLAAGQWVLSVVAKAATSSTLVLRFDSPAQTTSTFNLSTGAVSSGAGVISSLGGGWYLCSLSVNAEVINAVIQIGSVVGNSVHVDMAQLEPGAAVTSRIPTTTAAVTRAGDLFSPSTTDLTGGTGAGSLWTNLVPLANAYNPALSYAAAVEASFFGKVYRVVAGQTATEGQSPQTHPAKWEYVRIDRRLAPFDGEFESISGQFGVTPSYSYIVTLTSAMDCLLLSGLQGVTGLSVRVTDGLYGPVLFESTVTPDPGASVLRSQYLFTGFSAPAGASFSVTLRTGPALMNHGLKQISWGLLESLGSTRYGVRAGIRDYSRKEADDFGNVTFVRRSFAKTVSAQVEVEKADINRVSDRLYELRATPLVWVFTEDQSLSTPLVVFGFYRDFYGSIDYPQMSIYSIEVEGLA